MSFRGKRSEAEESREVKLFIHPGFFANAQNDKYNVCPFLCSSFKRSCRRLRGREICPAQLGELATKGLKSLSALPYLPLKRENIIEVLYPLSH